jgi:Fe2+ or Zn2+ uptake regulation protein
MITSTVAEKTSPAHEHSHVPPAAPVELRARGRRLTRQRRLIWETLAARPDEHLSADDVVANVRADLPRVNASTVYRTLDLLVDEGLLLRTDLGGERSYYEPAREHPHHHLVCERCGAVAHVHDEVIGDLRGRLEAATGYVVGDAEMTFFGLCDPCRPRSGSRARRR